MMGRRAPQRSIQAVNMAGILVLTVGSVFAACGGGTSLPDPPPCPTPTATATPGRGGGGATGAQNRYVREVQAGSTRLNDLLTGFRATWPENKFYRTGEFRTDFVNYAGAAACVTADLARLTPPVTPGRAADIDKALKPFLSDYEAALAQGREAVRARNTSDYRDWAKKMDELVARQAELLKPPGQ
ncbi:MAG: hypothetical protein ACKVT1_13390 [Dehalococcoidia bacterium]